MTSSENGSMTIDGLPVVRSVPGDYTGDRQHITSDGRVWTVHHGGVPNSLSTGDIIRAVRTNR